LCVVSPTELGASRPVLSRGLPRAGSDGAERHLGRLNDVVGEVGSPGCRRGVGWGIVGYSGAQWGNGDGLVVCLRICEQDL